MVAGFKEHMPNVKDAQLDATRVLMEKRAAREGMDVDEYVSKYFAGILEGDKGVVGLYQSEGLKTKISELYDYAVSKVSNALKKVELWRLEDSEAATIKEKTGIDVSGYMHVIDNYSINHILKEHGDPKLEAKRGQIAVTKEDVGMIPEIITKPDILENAGKTKQGLEGIRYGKKVNGFVIYVEEVRTGNKELTPVSMYKKAAAPDASSLQKPPAQTSETFSSPIDKNITSPDSSVNKLSEEQFIKENMGKGIVKKEKGRWGTTHYYIDTPELKPKGDYQRAGNKTFDSEEDALKFLYRSKAENILEQRHKDIKGAVQFLEDGRAVIHAFENADFSTVVHELGHVFRRQIKGDDLRILEDWSGVENGKWERIHEEDFARGFEKYLSEGKAPSEELKTVFEQFKKWIVDIYRSVMGYGLSDLKLSPEVRKVMDRLFVETELPLKKTEHPEAAEARKAANEEIQKLDEEIKRIADLHEPPPPEHTTVEDWGVGYGPQKKGKGKKKQPKTEPLKKEAGTIDAEIETPREYAKQQIEFIRDLYIPHGSDES